MFLYKKRLEFSVVEAGRLVWGTVSHYDILPVVCCSSPENMDFQFEICSFPVETVKLSFYGNFHSNFHPSNTVRLNMWWFQWSLYWWWSDFILSRVTPARTASQAFPVSVRNNAPPWHFTSRSVKSDHISNSFFHSMYGRSSHMAGGWR